MKKQQDDRKKLKDSIKALEHALSFIDKAEEDPFYYAGIIKSYEVSFECAWKYLRKKIMDEGMEAHSPKEVIKISGQIKLIDNVEKWLDFLEDRNLAVHDYMGVSEEDYLKTIKSFLAEVKKI